jgi:hypothetical protein
MTRPPTATEETRSQVARCCALDKQIAARRVLLRRECARQRVALRRVAVRVELLDHGRRR